MTSTQFSILQVLQVRVKGLFLHITIVLQGCMELMNFLTTAEWDSSRNTPLSASSLLRIYLTGVHVRVRRFTTDVLLPMPILQGLCLTIYRSTILTGLTAYQGFTRKFIFSFSRRWVRAVRKENFLTGLLK